MNRYRGSSFRSALVVLPLICLGLTTRSHAYIDLAPTLAKVMTDSKSIAVVEVTEFDRANHVVVLKPVRTLKGQLADDPIRHDVTSDEGGVIPRPILQWAGPGARAVLFVSRSTALVCVGQGWYQARSSEAGAVEARQGPAGPAAGVLRVAVAPRRGHRAHARRQGCCPYRGGARGGR